nr:Asp-tRNA(Asn)/Glu-tRNA(Gln) amidotransferase subunit GatA [Maliibacterium massiliense]
MRQEILELSACALAAALQKRELSAREVTECYLAQIEREEKRIGAYLHVTADAALAHAARVDAARAAGEAPSPLAGVPCAIKDNMCTRGVPTTCASRMLAQFVPPYDATAVTRLNEAGCVMLGKLNMDEFAMGSTTENSYFQVTHNPWDTARVPGGSSGGSAAAVAAKEAAVALGSDTGGSIRQPAAFCGVVGMKPTYGTVSRYGLVAFASSLDQIGPLTRDVHDNALVLGAIAGWDARDATSLKREAGDYARDIGRDIAGLRIALPREYYDEGLRTDIRACVFAAARKLEAMGACIVDASMPTIKNALPAYYILSSAEASSNLARFDGVKYGFRAGESEDIAQIYCRSRSEGFGPEVKRRIMLGSFVLSAGYYDAYYKKALQARTRIVQDFDRIFAQSDMILAPVAPTTAYRIGEKTQSPLEMYMGDIYTVPVNIAGLPALAMPCGRDEGGLPIGLQLIGPAQSEHRLYQAGAALEAALAEGGAHA